MITTKHVAWALLLLCSCTAVRPYQPLRLAVPDLPVDQMFVRARQVLFERYPRLAVSDADSFRLQSAWVDHVAAGRTGQRRASVYAEGRTLCVVVEVRYLIEDLFGPPSWSPIGGDHRLEEELAEALRASLRVPPEVEASSTNAASDASTRVSPRERRTTRSNNEIA